ncbi:MAG: molybdate transport system ATP-binding protein [Pseudomonadota bacterium]|jgi:molybdate transport system ATP-binding protein|nr:molybdate transport system ATP-binding protein [Pseudomonadota bacterium]
MSAPPIEARFRVDWPGFSLDVDLTLPGRGVTVLFGASGSGKTTLLRCLAGLERAPQGRLVVEGEVWQDVRTWRPVHRRPIGYVFQEASLFDHLSVMGNLRYGLRRLDRLLRGASSRRLAQAVALLGIEHLLERRPTHLSGGERQRVGIARALALGPRVLLMDEPLAALDQRRRQEILPYLERLRDELDIPVVYVTHAPDEVARLADQLVVLEAGRVQACGSLQSLLVHPDQPLRLGEEAGAVLEATIGEIDPRWHLARVDFDGAHLWTRDPGLAPGRRVRVRVLARDVSLADQPGVGSIQNVLAGEVESVGDDDHPALAMVRVRVGGAVLLARLTRRAVDQLGVLPGRRLWVQVKSVALLEGGLKAAGGM